MGETNLPSVAHVGYDISPFSRVKFNSLEWRNIVTHGQLKENLYILLWMSPLHSPPKKKRNLKKIRCLTSMLIIFFTETVKISPTNKLKNNNVSTNHVGYDISPFSRVKFNSLEWRNIVTHGQLKENLYILLWMSRQNR
jgi:hypothetical protein